MSNLVAIGEALGAALAVSPPLDAVVARLDDVLGQVLAEDVVAPCNVPLFTNSAMDGYAVRSGDTAMAPVVLRIIDTALAGRPATAGVGTGEAIRIMTGALVPPGADGVCMVESTCADGIDSVVVEVPVRQGQNIRSPGEDIREGEPVFGVGSVLRPAHLGVLASLGRTSVRVRPRPRVGVLSTGDELVDGSGSLGSGKIRDSNRHALLGTVRDSGFTAVDLGIVPDDRDRIRSVLRNAATSCEAVITSGGVSVGDADLVKEVLAEECGGTMRWMQVAVKPAKPFAVGTLAGESVPVFGLPGNPVSALVSFELFVRPALRRMAGHLDLLRPRVLAVADEPLERRPDGKIHLVRVRAHAAEDGVIHVRSAGHQASHMLRTMAAANALAILDDGDGVVAGEPVDVILIHSDMSGYPSPLLSASVPAP